MTDFILLVFIFFFLFLRYTVCKQAVNIRRKACFTVNIEDNCKVSDIKYKSPDL